MGLTKRLTFVPAFLFVVACYGQEIQVFPTACWLSLPATTFWIKPLLERDVTGEVRFFGGNLRATYDFAKKASGIAYENFSPTDSK